MTKHFHKIDELKSFRLFKFYQSNQDKGVAYVKVKSLDEALCRSIQKVRSRYWVATAECYFNSSEDIAKIIKFNKSFDFHFVSSEAVKKQIQQGAPAAKCLVLGAGEFMTSSELFRLENEGKRKVDFVTSANSFWSIKNFHKMLEMQKYLKDRGINTSSRIICGSVKDKWYLDECQTYINKNLDSGSKIIIGSSVDDLRKTYNESKFVVHFSSMDSSPRVIFEGLLCGCQCIVAGKWSQSLNDWLSSPLVHSIPKNDYSSVVDILKMPCNFQLTRKYGTQIGAVNVFPRIREFVKSNMQSTFTDRGIVGQSVVGKLTFKDSDDEYSMEMRRIQSML